jgi:hypothetical protein
MPEVFREVGISGRRTVCICINDESESFLKWSLQQYKLPLNIVRCLRNDNISESIYPEGMNIFIVESTMMNEPVISYLQKIRREHSSLRIILMVPPTIKKDEAIPIIGDKLVNGMLVQPFSTEVVWNYIDKICSVSRS